MVIEKFAPVCGLITTRAKQEISMKTLPGATISVPNMENEGMESRHFVEKTSWLRPYTRWATRVSLNSPQWLPAALRNAPLKLSSLILRDYHRALR